jgi:hypothetical protein
MEILPQGRMKANDHFSDENKEPEKQILPFFLSFLGFHINPVICAFWILIVPSVTLG